MNSEKEMLEQMKKDLDINVIIKTDKNVKVKS